jgi:cytochrome c-type biogenesis protein CcmH/NrfG
MGNDKKSNTTGKVVAAIVILVAVLIAGYLVGRSQNNSGSKSVQNGDAAASQTANRSAAVAELEAMLKEKPGDVDLLIMLGDAYFEAKQFSKAVNYYKSAIQADPANSELYNDIGLALHYMGNSAEGIRYIEEGIKQNPYQQRIWLTKGFILAYGMGDLDAANEAWEKTRALDPESGIGKAAADYLAQASKR